MLVSVTPKTFDEAPLVGKNNNIIIINGKRYDARTGAALGNQSVDGLMKSSKHAPKVVDLAPHKTHTAPVAIVSKPTMSDVARKPAKHAVKHAPQSSQTLMRHAVKKPQPSLKRQVKAQSHAGAIKKQPSVALAPKRSISHVDPSKVQLAKTVPKSKLISRFGASKPAAHHVINPKPIVASRPHPIAPVAPKKATTTNDLLQQALQHATSHEQTYTPPKTRRGSSKIVGLAAGSFIVFALLTFGAAQGLNSIRLHVASSKAGFAAAVPTYKPAGYSLSKLSYDPGNVGLHFTSNSDDRAFTITEKASEWDSNTLRDMIVSPAGQKFQTIESAGRTIYIDDQQNANWVNGGVWYQVKATNALSDKQLVDIANSL